MKISKTKVFKLAVVVLVMYVSVSFIQAVIEQVEVMNNGVYEWLYEYRVEIIVGRPPIEEIGVEAQIRRVFGTKHAEVALAVSQSENGSRKCDRIGVSGDIGVFQINPWVHDDKASPEELKDCLTNIRVAKQIFDTSGWYPWVDFNNGNYLAYMK